MRPLESPASPIALNSVSRNIGNVYSGKPAIPLKRSWSAACCLPVVLNLVQPFAT